jgi:5'-nucleotidase
MKTILVDVDGTVARLHDEWYRRYNNDYNDNLTDEKVTGWSLHKFVKPECGEKIYSYLSDPSLYDNVKPYDGSLFVIKELAKRGYNIVYVSAGISGAVAKYNWLLREKFILTSYQPEAYFIVAFNKSLILGDMLIDDRDKNVMEYPRGGILLDRPYNLATQIDPRLNVKRANSWQKVLNIFNVMEMGAI